MVLIRRTLYFFVECCVKSEIAANNRVRAINLEKDPEIFLSIVERHKGILYRIANNYCQQVLDRQDLVQEMVIQIWSSFEKYDSNYKQSTWIYRIALNTAISFYRKNKNLGKSEEMSPLLETSIIDDEPYNEDPKIVLLKGFIGELNEINKALILLYLEGFKNKEIAELMGFSATNVSTKIFRIKEELRNKFKNLKIE